MIQRKIVIRATFLLLLLFPFAVFAQKERSDIRSGNELFSKGDFKGAEVKYRSALQLKSDSREALSNLGGALFKQKLGDDAAAIYERVVAQSADLEPSVAAQAHYDLGNTYLQDRKLDQAIESYKNSLRLNPSDRQAKFNLAYAQKLKQDGDGGGGGGNDDKKDQKQDQQQQNQDQQSEPEQQKSQEPQKSEQRMDAERMLNAIQAAEDRTKKEVDKKREKGQPVSGSKQW